MSTPRPALSLYPGRSCGRTPVYCRTSDADSGLQEQHVRLATDLAEHRVLRVAAQVPRLHRPDQPARLGLEHACRRRWRRRSRRSGRRCRRRACRAAASATTRTARRSPRAARASGRPCRPRGDRVRRCRRRGRRSTPRTRRRPATAATWRSVVVRPDRGGPATHSPVCSTLTSTTLPNTSVRPSVKRSGALAMSGTRTSSGGGAVRQLGGNVVRTRDAAKLGDRRTLSRRRRIVAHEADLDELVVPQRPAAWAARGHGSTPTGRRSPCSRRRRSGAARDGCRSPTSAGQGPPGAGRRR